MAMRRRGWVLLVTVVVVTGCAFLVARTQARTYTAEGIGVVSATPHGLLTPDQANQLAVTYAVLIPKDTAVANNVARAVHTTASDVQHRMSVFNNPQTALLAIDYRGTSASNALAGATAILNAISGPTPASPNIVPGSVGAVQVPARATSSSGVAVLVAIGGILGIALGVLLTVAWERADPRIDRLEDLSQEVGSPTSSLSEISDLGAKALIARWIDIDHEAVRVALVPVTADVEVDLPKVAIRFAQDRETMPIIPRRGLGEAEHAPRPKRIPSHSVIACAVPSRDLGARRTIMECDLAVVVARRGTSRAALREALDALTEFGVTPKWAIFGSARELQGTEARQT